ncbi:hypothetical protein KFL_002160020 [Klebsormidium nitens]|uniref:Uncharacterized protein n=1 Tax=Klebsormidium nitens TaxID=105231 RepID=A0A1Y1I4V6_KLENI|nr:hypothetical protein KFL_002160020 [Klebsormidium nitens]|eukprot:GAQ84992.1 hypothetical protein KFL_002160020 [Klebsormidium nitens]
MDTTFAFWPVDYNRTFPQYTCQWHPCGELSPQPPVVHTCGSQGKGEEAWEDSDRRSGSSDAGEPSSSDSSATSSGAFEWPPYSHPRWEASRLHAAPPHGAARRSCPFPDLQGDPPCPCEEITAKRLHSDGWQGAKMRHSWDALWAPSDPSVSSGGAQQGLADRLASKREVQQAREPAEPPALAPGWQRDLGCLAQWAREAASLAGRTAMAPEPPLSPSCSAQSPRPPHQAATLSGRHKRFSSGALAHSPVSDVVSPVPSYRSPRARRHVARLSEPGQPHPSAPGIATRGVSCSEKCALCNDLLDLNRALYRTDCGVLCHLQCVRVERNQSPLMCRFCGRADQWLLSSPHRPEPVGVH